MLDDNKDFDVLDSDTLWVQELKNLLNFEAFKKNHKKLCDAVYGVAIGDALGVPFEFESRNTFQCVGMVGHGTHDQPAGTWSDDTSMTLATLQSIKEKQEIDVDDIREKFLSWVNESKYTATGELFDIGHTTLKALKRGRGMDGKFENGNGSLMRILPLAFAGWSDEDIREVSSITHAHHISTEACVIYVHIARRLLEGESIDHIIPSLIYDDPFDRLWNINTLAETDIQSSGYVVDTLEAALWAISCKGVDAKTGLPYVHGFKEDLIRAVNLGDDTDTTGAVAGGLLGIIYGLNQVQDWVALLQGRNVLEEVLSIPKNQ